VAERPRDQLSARLGHRFERPELLTEALTHPSIAGSGRRRRADYERLEFLGDRVLGLVISDALLRRFARADAGELARRYNALVCREALVQVAEAIDLGDHLHMARSERDVGGHEKPGILADACEALIGALYLDGGLEAAAAFIDTRWDAMIGALAQAPKDAKTHLQEWAQGLGRPAPTYRTVECTGPAHDPVFTVEVAVEGAAPARASGGSKRAAEHAAAQAMLAALAAAGALGDE
jgi:ribonuclease-3